MNRREFLTYTSGAVVGASLSRMDGICPGSHAGCLAHV